MAEMWDYKIRKMDMAWELALRLIPKMPTDSGRWTEKDYLKNAQETLREANEAIDAIFKDA
jgi:hypothetical protein